MSAQAAPQRPGLCSLVTGTVSGIGASTNEAVGETAGSSVVQALSDSATGNGTAAGAATVSGVGASISIGYGDVRRSVRPSSA